MTKGAGMEEFYEKMGGELTSYPWGLPTSPTVAFVLKLMAAVTPDEAAVPFADFIEKVNLDMTGQFWAPSMSSLSSASGNHCEARLTLQWGAGKLHTRRLTIQRLTLQRDWQCRGSLGQGCCRTDLAIATAVVDEGLYRSAFRKENVCIRLSTEHLKGKRTEYPCKARECGEG